MAKAAKTIDAYRHRQPDASQQEPDLQPGSYYISCFNRRSNVPGDGSMALVSGPYATHAEALALVDLARAVSERHDCRAAFHAFGTCRLEVGTDRPGALQRWGYSLDLETRV